MDSSAIGRGGMQITAFWRGVAADMGLVDQRAFAGPTVLK